MATLVGMGANKEQSETAALKAEIKELKKANKVLEKELAALKPAPEPEK